MKKARNTSGKQAVRNPSLPATEPKVVTLDYKRMEASGVAPPPEPEEELEAPVVVDKEAERARRRRHAELLSRLEPYRPWLSETFNYYAVGHDSATSALSGRKPLKRLNLLDDKRHPLTWIGTDKDDDDVEQRLRLYTMTPEERQNLNFFFGGCGDCRHVYTTLYDLGCQLPTVQGTLAAIGNRVHLLLNDSSPAIIARNAILVFALYELAEFSQDEDQLRLNSNAVILISLLHHVWLSLAIPSYVNDVLMSVINLILGRGPKGLPHPSIIISDESWPAVEKVLTHWKELGDLHRTFLRAEAPQQLEYHLGLAQEQAKQEVVDNMKAQLQREVMDTFVGVPDEEQMWKLRKLVNHAVHQIFIMQESNLETLQIYPDLVFFALFGVLPPGPGKEFWNFHNPETWQIYEQVCKLCKTPVGELVADTGRVMASLVGNGYNLDAVMSDYMLNVTSIEPLLKPNWQEDPENAIVSSQYPCQWNTLSILNKVFHFAIFQPPRLKIWPSMFALSWSLWSTAADGVRSLTNEPQSRCTVEMILGDMNQVIHQLSLAAEERKASLLPTQMLRAFISNVQDYTGLMFPLINISRALLPSPKAFIRCNQMYNCHWQDCEQWAKAMLAVPDARHVGPGFGASIMPHSRLPFFTWLGKQLDQGADLDPANVRTILQGVFIGVAFPPSQAGRRQRLQPRLILYDMYVENLTVLVELIISLLERGFSRATMSEIIAEMLDENLCLTNPRPPQLAADALEPAEVPVRPFLAELSALLTLFQPVLDLTIPNQNSRLQPPPDTVFQHTLTLARGTVHESHRRLLWFDYSG